MIKSGRCVHARQNLDGGFWGDGTRKVRLSHCDRGTKTSCSEITSVRLWRLSKIGKNCSVPKSRTQRLASRIMLVECIVMSISKKNDPKFVMAYDRSMFRSAFVSLFWAVISDRKKQGGFTLQGLAKRVGSTKHEVSRWFNGNPPNWTLNTVASIANALDVDIKIEVIERASGRVFTPAGAQSEPYRRPTISNSEGAVQPVTLTRTLVGSEVRSPTTMAA